MSFTKQTPDSIFGLCVLKCGRKEGAGKEADAIRKETQVLVGKLSVHTSRK